MTVVLPYLTNPKLVEVEEEADLEVVVVEAEEGLEVEPQLVWEGSSREECQGCAPLEMILAASGHRFCHLVVVALVHGHLEDLSLPLVSPRNAVNL